MTLSYILPILSLSGYTWFLSRYCRIAFHHGLMITIALILIGLFLCALAGVLQQGSQLLIILSVISMTFACIDFIKDKERHYKLSSSVQIYLWLTFASIIMILPAYYRVSDEFVYWGIVSKAIYVDNALPTSNTTIWERHLTYPPGMAMLHYYFYQLIGGFSQNASYFAQSQWCIASLMLLYRRDDSVLSNVNRLVIIYIMLALFFGYVAAKLQVDHLIALGIGTVLLLYYEQSQGRAASLVLVLLMCALTLIKQIGLFFVVGAVAMCLHDSWRYKRQCFMNTLVVMSIALLLIFALKTLWHYYCQQQGFISFMSHGEVNSFGAVIASMLDKQSIKAFKLFIYYLLFAEADRLQLPYILWFALILGAAYKFWQSKQTDRMMLLRCKQALLWWLLIGFVYLLMLFVLEIQVFDLGKSLQQPLSFPRYFNIYFVPTMIVFGLYLSTTDFLRAHVRLCLMVMLSLASLQTIVLFLKPMEPENKVTELYSQSVNNLPLSKRLCIVMPYNDYILCRYNYFLYPRSIQSVWASSLDDWPGQIKHCDALLLHDSSAELNQYLQVTGWGDAKTGDLLSLN